MNFNLRYNNKASAKFRPTADHIHQC